MDIILHAIGHVRGGGRTDPIDDGWGNSRTRLELDGERFEPDALAGFTQIEVIYLFDKGTDDKIVVGARHPRGRTEWPLVGIFAQRGKNRPNRLGVTDCRIIAVDGRGVAVVELRPPHGTDFASLRPLIPTFFSYLLSFVYLGIYWNNHHHMLHLVKSVNGPILWANLHLLFWLSLTPFGTAWLAEGYRESVPVAVYAGLLFMNAIAYTTLVIMLSRHKGAGSKIDQAFGRDYKGKVSLACYLAAIVLAFILPAASIVLCATVALIWFIPDRRVERTLGMH